MRALAFAFVLLGILSFSSASTMLLANGFAGKSGQAIDWDLQGIMVVRNQHPGESYVDHQINLEQFGTIQLLARNPNTANSEILWGTRNLRVNNNQFLIATFIGGVTPADGHISLPNIFTAVGPLSIWNGTRSRILFLNTAVNSERLTILVNNQPVQRTLDFGGSLVYQLPDEWVGQPLTIQVKDKFGNVALTDSITGPENGVVSAFLIYGDGTSSKKVGMPLMKLNGISENEFVLSQVAMASEMPKFATPETQGVLVTGIQEGRKKHHDSSSPASRVMPFFYFWL